MNSVQKWLPLAVLAASMALAPLSLRVLNDWQLGGAGNRSYLPSLENRRTRKGFRAHPIDELRAHDPAWVFIGDSMLGTRIDPALLASISGRGDRNVSFLFQAASGPAYWYLVFKNYLVASGVKPRMTFFFFRDTNMTDTLYRLQTQLGEALDEVALAYEPELDAAVAARRRGGWARLDRVFNRLYELDTAAAWMHPTLRRWYALRRYPEPAMRLDFENFIEEDFNRNFRRDLAADMRPIEDDADFARDLPSSILPLVMQLSREHGLPVCFVRVQRRPVGNAPPPQSPALQAYIHAFRAWAEEQGACFHDDHGDPELTLDLYEDGDHFDDKDAYTRLFRRRLDAYLR